MGCVCQDMEPLKSICTEKPLARASFLRKSSVMMKPIRRVPVTKAVRRHANIRDQKPSRGIICPGEPHQRNPNGPKFEDRSQEEAEWQERRAREAAWKLARNILKQRRNISLPSSHQRKTGVSLHHLKLNRRKENLS